MSKVLIIGDGTTSMAAAVSAASVDHEVHIYEKNEKLGKRVYITGKGRCNVANACDIDTLFQNVVTNPKSLYSSLYGSNNRDAMDLLEECGYPLKTERGIRIFPVSDKSSDVIKALTKKLEELDVTVHYRQPMQDLLLEGGRCVGLMLGKSREKARGDAVIVATSEPSYQTTGPTGDGYRLAKKAGRQVTELSPALVPFEMKGPVVRSLQGLALKDIEAVILDGEKRLYREFDEVLLTHFGINRPALLSTSDYVTKVLQGRALILSIDLKPVLTRGQLDARLLREFEEVSDKQFKSALIHVYPARLLPVMVERNGIFLEEKVNEITRERRQGIVEVTKNFRLTITGLRDYEEAIITQGDVLVKGVSPSTMESKRVAGLYFAGEMLDLDAVTGGFNLQAAWSTGYAAGAHVEYMQAHNAGRPPSRGRAWQK